MWSTLKMGFPMINSGTLYSKIRFLLWCPVCLKLQGNDWHLRCCSKFFKLKCLKVEKEKEVWWVEVWGGGGGDSVHWLWRIWGIALRWVWEGFSWDLGRTNYLLLWKLVPCSSLLLLFREVEVHLGLGHENSLDPSCHVSASLRTQWSLLLQSERILLWLGKNCYSWWKLVWSP